MNCARCNKEHDGTFGSGKYCSRQCANSRERSASTKEKISKGVKNAIDQGRYAGVVRKGTKMPPRTPEHLEKISAHRIAYWDRVGRRTQDEMRAGNKANVYAYRARKYKAVPADADLALIKKIYSMVPVGYQVDHIVALANGGKHHQDNLQYLPNWENARKGKRDAYDQSLVIRWQDIVRM